MSELHTRFFNKKIIFLAEPHFPNIELEIRLGLS